ncbi:uncharacterized protein RCH25_043716 [Pelodytes ibericus]
MAGHGRAERYNMWLATILVPQAEEYHQAQADPMYEKDAVTSETYRGILDLSDEVLLLLLDFLDPYSLIRVGATCTTLYRISNTDSLWDKHCKITLGYDIRIAQANYTQKEAFKLLYIWTKLYKTLPYNRPLQDLLFSGIPPKRYWIQWLVLEEIVPLPPIQLTECDIKEIWGITDALLDEKNKVTDGSLEEAKQIIFKYEWRELFNIASEYHGTYSKMQTHVLQKMTSESHEELEWLFGLYARYRFQWLFSYWLFGLSKSCARQLQRIYLWWKTFDKRKIFGWGSTHCDVEYLASLHYITQDYWNGKLANGDENLGIQTIENYFSMCKSLLAWILGRSWGRFKQKKVYKDSLEGVYRMLKSDMRGSMITHEKFWEAAKLQMLRVCRLEKIAGNYVNWKLIDTLPSYRLHLATGDAFYLEQIKGLLFRKHLINDWLKQDENMWVRNLLPDGLYHLLEYETKICEDGLYGDTVLAQLSRLIWLYLHSGQQLYMDAMKGFVYECAYASFQSQIFDCCHIVSILGY